MTDPLRALAEAEATERYGEKRRGFDLLPVDYVHGGKKDGFVEGFIAGRTSVTREQVVAVVSKAMDGACSCHLDRYISDGVNAVLALLNGDNDDQPA